MAIMYATMPIFINFVKESMGKVFLTDFFNSLYIGNIASMKASVYLNFNPITFTKFENPYKVEI